ncbi:WG repeat-containing protein [Sanguibacteroides justesenii]|uniref:WG repeat-containing protein n=1 Tax=Sanguibacteroides justesenii TaxID=1547597 RepID=A0AB34R1Y2_9PORP|nr:WG repeat-containing protein [Sanguibacteroides justesenii]KIO44235.1 hypothetical protein IE90_09160 [Sanguibacteroides justesenii]
MKYTLLLCLIGLLLACKEKKQINFIGYAHQIANGKWGFINETGEEIVAYKFDGAKDFKEGVAVVRMGNGYGFINTKGKIVIPLKYEQAESFQYGLAIVTQNAKKGIINLKGEKVVDCLYDELHIFPEEGVAKARKENKYGYINLSGKEMIPFRYDEIFAFDSTGIALVKQNGKLGYVSRDGKEILPCLYNDIQKFGAYLYSITNDSLSGFINLQKQMVTPCQYQSATFCDADGELYNGEIIRVEAEGKFGLIDSLQNEITSCIYDAIGKMSNRLFRIYKDDALGLLDENGDIALPSVYKDIYWFDKERQFILVLNQDNQVGLLNDKGAPLTRCIYTHIEPFNSMGYALVRAKGKEGYVNKKGKEVVPCIYSYVYPISEDQTVQVRNDKGVTIRLSINN